MNCWQIKDTETNWMWSEYVKGNGGVAINTTYKNLTKCFLERTKFDIHCGKIKYIDYKSDKFSELRGFEYYLHKRKPFTDENELRAMVLLMPHEKNKIPEDDFNESGIYVPVDLNILLDRVVLSPNGELWLRELVQSLLDNNNLHKTIETSELIKKPVNI